MLVHSTTLRVHQPFDTVMENSGVKQGLQSRLCYLAKRISRWLRIAPQRRIQRQMTSPITPPEVYAQTWHADVGNIMHMVPCIAYCIHQICHLLSLDMLCVNAIRLVSLSYM